MIQTPVYIIIFKFKLLYKDSLLRDKCGFILFFIFLFEPSFNESKKLLLLSFFRVLYLLNGIPLIEILLLFKFLESKEKLSNVVDVLLSCALFFLLLFLTKLSSFVLLKSKFFN